MNKPFSQWQSSLRLACVAFCVLFSSCNGARNDPSSQYVPSIREGDYYRFSDAQLKHMAETPLDRDAFLQYVEAEWPISKLRSRCTSEDRCPDGFQNLVGDDLFGNIAVHGGKSNEFDNIYVYVCEDDGKSNYYGSAGTDWRRWEYSLNVLRGKDWWVFLECLPNDFMDNLPKYVARPATPRKRTTQ